MVISRYVCKVCHLDPVESRIFVFTSLSFTSVTAFRVSCVILLMSLHTVPTINSTSSRHVWNSVTSSTFPGSIFVTSNNAPRDFSRLARLIYKYWHIHLHLDHGHHLLQAFHFVFMSCFFSTAGACTGG